MERIQYKHFTGNFTAHLKFYFLYLYFSQTQLRAHLQSLLQKKNVLKKIDTEIVNDFLPELQKFVKTALSSKILEFASTKMLPKNFHLLKEELAAL